MTGTDKPAAEINRRAVLAAAGIGIAAGATSLLVACEKHSQASPSPTPQGSKPGRLDLEIPRSAFGNGQGTYTVLLCNDNDTLISNAALNAVAGDHTLPQRIVFDGGQHVLIVRGSSGSQWTHPVQLPEVDQYEVDSVSVSVADDQGETKGTPPFGFKAAPFAENACPRFEVCGGTAVCSVRG